MTTFALVHGAGDTAAAWDGVAAPLRAAGHDVVAVDLPCEDDTKDFTDYADVVIEAIWNSQPNGKRADGRRDLIVVAHSLGAFTGTLVAAETRARQMVYVSGMVPAPGESANEWWENTNLADAPKDTDHDGSDIAVFLQDMPREQAEAYLATGRDQSGAPMDKPFPLDALPDTDYRAIVCRDDRVFPAPWLRGVVRDRLGIEADEIEGGHCPYVSRPSVLAARLMEYAS